MSLWTGGPWDLQVAHHILEARREARAIVYGGIKRAGYLPRGLHSVPAAAQSVEDLYLQRALLALDAIRLGTEGRLRLKSSAVMSTGVITEYSEPLKLRDRDIVRAAKRALSGEVRPRSRR